ncbi:AAA family ATPase [Nocardiopsis sp. FIRDI 009]|uniref:cytidylate kinase-like family protein n=1 Tax=Nocardiopsis sp. FIRDI 009 TaxID=714197 RepID=UPI001E63C7C1|nr:cytidylate kinase-like family protein [Nocardiopsis sp. FIRDI 009]
MNDDTPRGGGPVVTISATFGSGGGVIGPAVATRLRVPFLDRAVPTAVAAHIGCSLEEALRHDGRSPGGLERLLASAARLPTITLGSVDTALSGPTDTQGRLLYDHEFVEETERVIGEVAHSGGVVLGRAAAVVLADHPTALHVRIDGDRRARLRRARELWESGNRDEVGGYDWCDTPPTLRLLDDNDRARAAYVRRFYRVDPASLDLYHLFLDGTALTIPACVDVVVHAARGRRSAEGGTGDSGRGTGPTP